MIVRWMKKNHKISRLSKILNIVLIIILLPSFGYSQVNKNVVWGKWKITNVVGLLSSDIQEKQKIYKECIRKKVMIDSLEIKMYKSECFLHSFKNLKLSFVEKLSKKEAENLYSVKFISTVYVTNLIETVEMYKTNYAIDNDELGYLGIIVINNNKIILRCEDYLLSLNRLPR